MGLWFPHHRRLEVALPPHCVEALPRHTVVGTGRPPRDCWAGCANGRAGSRSESGLPTRARLATTLLLTHSSDRQLKALIASDKGETARPIPRQRGPGAAPWPLPATTCGSSALFGRKPLALEATGGAAHSSARAPCARPAAPQTPGERSLLSVHRDAYSGAPCAAAMRAPFGRRCAGNGPLGGWRSAQTMARQRASSWPPRRCRSEAPSPASGTAPPDDGRVWSGCQGGRGGSDGGLLGAPQIPPTAFLAAWPGPAVRGLRRLAHCPTARLPRQRL